MIANQQTEKQAIFLLFTVTLEFYVRLVYIVSCGLGVTNKEGEVDGKSILLTVGCIYFDHLKPAAQPLDF